MGKTLALSLDEQLTCWQWRWGKTVPLAKGKAQMAAQVYFEGGRVVGRDLPSFFYQAFPECIPWIRPKVGPLLTAKI